MILPTLRPPTRVAQVSLQHFLDTIDASGRYHTAAAAPVKNEPVRARAYPSLLV